MSCVAALVLSAVEQQQGYEGYVEALRELNLTPIGARGEAGLWVSGRF